MVISQKNNRRDGYHGPERAATASELRELAHAVRRIHDPLRNDPEQVLIAKDGIARRLLTIANQMEAAR